MQFTHTCDFVLVPHLDASKPWAKQRNARFLNSSSQECAVLSLSHCQFYTPVNKRSFIYGLFDSSETSTVVFSLLRFIRILMTIKKSTKFTLGLLFIESFHSHLFLWQSHWQRRGSLEVSPGSKYSKTSSESWFQHPWFLHSLHMLGLWQRQSHVWGSPLASK